MSNNKITTPTTNLPPQAMQFNNFNNVPIQTQSSQPKQTMQPDLEKRRQRSSQHSSQKRKITEMETTKHKSEYEGQTTKHKSDYEGQKQLKALMEKYGTKAKMIENLESETVKLRRNIEELKYTAQMQGKQFQVSPPPPPPPPQQPSHNIKQESTEFNIWQSAVTITLLPFQLFFQLLRVIYQSLNWNFILFTLLFVELSLITIIWGIRRSYTSTYVDPYEAVVHGTFGVEPSPQWVTVFWTSVTIIQDFFGEVINGGRGFGSPSYSGLVPT